MGEFEEFGLDVGPVDVRPADRVPHVVRPVDVPASTASADGFPALTMKFGSTEDRSLVALPIVPSSGVAQ